MAFIRFVPRAEAQGTVAEVYAEIEGRLGYFPNWAKAFSLRPDGDHVRRGDCPN